MKRNIAIPATKTGCERLSCEPDSPNITSMYTLVLLDPAPLKVEPASLPLRIKLASSAFDSDQSNSSYQGQLCVGKQLTLVLKLA